MDLEDSTNKLPESEARRKLELELFYHYAIETAPTISLVGLAGPIWGSIMCQAALKSDAVLYCVCLMALLHKAHIAGVADSGHNEHLSLYLNMAIREHREDVSQLSAANVDYACLTSNALRVYDLVRLQYRSLEPYTPPIHWLRMTGATHIVFLKARALGVEYPDSLGNTMLRSASHLLEELDSLPNVGELSHLLSRQEPHELAEPWGNDEREAYNAAIGVLGGIWKYRRHHAPNPDLYMRLILFPMFLSDQFIKFVEERRPRALVILAHYFTSLLVLRKSWIVGDAGLREARAIADSLGPEWQGLLSEPLEMLNAAA